MASYLVVSAAQLAARRRQAMAAAAKVHARKRRVIEVAAGLAVVALVFAYFLPKIANCGGRSGASSARCHGRGSSRSSVGGAHRRDPRQPADSVPSSWSSRCAPSGSHTPNSTRSRPLRPARSSGPSARSRSRPVAWEFRRSPQRSLGRLRRAQRSRRRGDAALPVAYLRP
jgi:hypothetical protein